MQPCPRQQESGMAVLLKHESKWDEEGRCSYCGSISPELLFKAIEERCELGPTDKNYKVYVKRPNPKFRQLRIVGSANYHPPYGNYIEVTAENINTFPFDKEIDKEGAIGRWVQVGQHSMWNHDKFYFQHLTVEECKQFVELHNSKKLVIGVPGYFYSLPFFMRKI